MVVEQFHELGEVGQLDAPFDCKFVEDPGKSSQSLEVGQAVKYFGIAKRELRVIADRLEKVILIEARVLDSDVAQDGAFPFGDWASFFLHEEIGFDAEVPKPKKTGVVRISRLMARILEIKRMLELRITCGHEAVELSLAWLK